MHTQKLSTITSTATVRDLTQTSKSTLPARQTTLYRTARRITTAVALALAAAALSACASTSSNRSDNSNNNNANTPTASTTATSNPDVIGIYVHGFGCPLCATNIERAMLALRGVTSVDVDLGQGRVDVHTLPGIAPTRAQLAATVKDAGFTLVRFADDEGAAKQ